MTIYEECKLFKSWGQNDPNYYKVFVGAGLTTDQYKELTGEDYVAPSPAL
ncbi:XkdX family protein [Lactiplantibacillus plantarum]|nr:XkdX family protein [Lactiplantibacillus plantarum]MCG0815648.1 XkdX family protein [Lactiplantibacillus plantarum]MCG0818405.1 XkdX family protein [Lactiplantibacillus plantarum]MCG0840649.1 XkdX family protein [Lactiplantibacillus plantarum]MCG0937807.1 XkdX family protein [Lactiplantibacillus plantarum]